MESSFKALSSLISSPMASSPKPSCPTAPGSSASATSPEICSYQSKLQIQALQKAAEGGWWSILQWATYLEAEHDTVDGSSDEILPTTTIRKASMGQEEGRHSPLEGE
jgi:hypothetical protein